MYAFKAPTQGALTSTQWTGIGGSKFHAIFVHYAIPREHLPPHNGPETGFKFHTIFVYYTIPREHLPPRNGPESGFKIPHRFQLFAQYPGLLVSLPLSTTCTTQLK